MYLQMTSRNVIVTYSTLSGAVLSQPQIIEGWAEDSFLVLDMVDQVEVEKSLDNITFGYVKPVIMKGKLRLLPASPGQQVFQQTQLFQTQTGVIAPGTLTVTYPGITTVVTYNNFTITSPFVGFGLDKRIDNVEIGFSCDLPDTSALNSIVQLGLASIGSF